MQGKENGTGSGAESERTGTWARVSLFWLIVGGLLLFFGATAIMQRSGIWSEADAEYAGDGVVILLGITAIAYALKGVRPEHRRESA